MSPEALEARRKYMKEYRKAHRSRINEQSRTWRKNNPDKIKEITERYWAKKAATIVANEM